MTALALWTLLLGCGGQPPPLPQADAAAPVRDHTVKIYGEPDTLTLVLFDPSGAPVHSDAEARVMLWGTGVEQTQRMILKPADGRWTAPAKAEGAPGYRALVKVPMGDRMEDVELIWGDYELPKL